MKTKSSWINMECINAIKAKRYKFKLYRKNPNILNETELKTLNKNCNTIIKNAKLNYESNIIANSSNTKSGQQKFWKHCNNVFKSNKKINGLTIDGIFS